MDSITPNPPLPLQHSLTEGAELVALVASRICHDLISPLGAISNGVELLMMEGDAGLRPEIALIAESVASATAKIRFLRVALGPSQSDQRLDFAQIQAILTDNFHGSRLQVQWLLPHDVPRTLVRQAFLGLMCLQHALPTGGMIEVHHTQGLWQLTAKSTRLQIDPTLWPLLIQGARPQQIAPQHVQFALLRDSLLSHGSLADLTYGDDSIRLQWHCNA